MTLSVGIGTGGASAIAELEILLAAAGLALTNCRRNEKVLIWGEDIKLLELGFEADTSDKPITYDKIVDKSELEELYEEREYGTWNDIEFVINGETEKTYTIWYWNKDENMCKLLGMKVYDKGIYVKEVPKTEVTNYRIEKEDLLHK